MFGHWYGSGITDGHSFGLGMLLFAALLIWSVAWKGLALWHAARDGRKVWFVVLLLVNTVGLLDIIYIYFVGKHKLGRQHNHKK